MVVLEGEAGIGKTFLLEEALEEAEALGFRCLVGSAEELERHRPFGAISESLGIGRRGRGTGVAHPGEDERRPTTREPFSPSHLAPTRTRLRGARPRDFA